MGPTVAPPVDVDDAEAKQGERRSMFFPIPPSPFTATGQRRRFAPSGNPHRRAAVRLVLVCGCLAMLGCLAARAQSSPDADKPDAPPDVVDLRRAEQIILERTNHFRQRHGRDPLTRHDALQEAAKRFARFMSKNDRYGHTADGRTPAERAEAAGYAYCVVRENIAYVTDSGDNQAQPLAEQLAEGWQESPEHRENLLADGITEIGVALATGRGRTFYAVQLFGRPASAAFAVELINRSPQTVTLQIASDEDKETIDLPPNVRLSMQRCRPATLSLADGAASVEVREPQSLQIVAGGDGKLSIEQTESPDTAATNDEAATSPPDQPKQ